MSGTVQPQASTARRNGILRMLIPISMLIVSFILAMLLTQGTTTTVNGVETFQSSIFPSGVENLASLYVQLTLPPTALFVFLLAGLLVPPAPFLTGASLGLLDGLLWSALFLLATAEGSVVSSRLITPTDVITILLVAAVVGAIVTGIVGTIMARVVRAMRPKDPATWPPGPWITPPPPSPGCTSCGQPTVVGGSYCGSCGAPITSVKPP